MNENQKKMCRFYQGEDKCPKGVNPQLWQLEKDYFSNSGETDISGNLSEYYAYGLADFNKTDGTPLALKVLLFNRYSHWNRPDPEAFKAWYLAEYLQQK